MKELEKIRNATRELHALWAADNRKFDMMRQSMSHDQKNAARERLYKFENQLQNIAAAINDLQPFEVAADQATRYAFNRNTNSTTFYRQIFEKERLRAEHNNQFKTR